MRIPQSPPDFHELWEEAGKAQRLTEVFGVASGPQAGARYHHWDKLRRLKPPADLDYREWWLATKLRRRSLLKALPLRDIRDNPFVYALPDPIPERLHDIDMHGGGTIGMPEAVTNPDTKDRYLITSLVEEAITSSQLEGAATTRRVAREMIRIGRKPKDRSETMILNNYRTMQRIGELRKERLSPELICDLHRLVTQDTLDEPSMAGRFRTRGQVVDVGDLYGQVFHTPPPAEQLDERVKALSDFANADTPKEFVHPVIRSIAVHFWLAYDHPFVDGNGRTARALFYWSMLHRGFWVCEFFSISAIILKGPAKYGRAFLYTETDDNDLTYFLLYHLDVIRRALDRLREYIERKTTELRRLQQELRGMRFLNHRQQALVSHALRNPQADYSIESHRASHGVVYQTARTDLLGLTERGLLESRKVGKEWHFTPASDLEQRLRDLPESRHGGGLDRSSLDWLAVFACEIAASRA